MELREAILNRRSVRRYLRRSVSQDMVREVLEAGRHAPTGGNMLLSAVSLGLGSCWVSGSDAARPASILELPAGSEPVDVLPLGYPAVQPAAPHKPELDEIVHYERYGCYSEPEEE